MFSSSNTTIPRSSGSVASSGPGGVAGRQQGGAKRLGAAPGVASTRRHGHRQNGTQLPAHAADTSSLSSPSSANSTATRNSLSGAGAPAAPGDASSATSTSGDDPQVLNTAANTGAGQTSLGTEVSTYSFNYSLIANCFFRFLRIIRNLNRSQLQCYLKNNV